MKVTEQRAQGHDEGLRRAHAAPAALVDQETAYVPSRDGAHVELATVPDRRQEQAGEAQVVAHRARFEASLGDEVAGVVREQPLLRRRRRRRDHLSEHPQPTQVAEQRPEPTRRRVVPVARRTPSLDVTPDLLRAELRHRDAFSSHPSAEVSHEFQQVDGTRARAPQSGELCAKALRVRAKRSPHCDCPRIFHSCLLSRAALARERSTPHGVAIMPTSAGPSDALTR